MRVLFACTHIYFFFVILFFLSSALLARHEFEFFDKNKHYFNRCHTRHKQIYTKIICLIERDTQRKKKQLI